jgi:hypothetical protein
MNALTWPHLKTLAESAAYGFWSAVASGIPRDTAFALHGAKRLVRCPSFPGPNVSVWLPNAHAAPGKEANHRSDCYEQQQTLRSFLSRIESKREEKVCGSIAQPFAQTGNNKTQQADADCTTETPPQ